MDPPRATPEDGPGEVRDLMALAARTASAPLLATMLAVPAAAERDFPRLIEVCEALARQAVERSGGAVEADSEGGETLVIPAAPVRPSALEKSSDPGPAAGSRYSEEELEDVPAPEE